jgi:hypothetical protein
MAAPPKSSPLLGPADTIPGRGRLRRFGPPRPDWTGPSVRAGSVAHRDHRGTSGHHRSPTAKRSGWSTSLQLRQLAQRQAADQIVVPKVRLGASGSRRAATDRRRDRHDPCRTVADHRRARALTPSFTCRFPTILPDLLTIRRIGRSRLVGSDTEEVTGSNPVAPTRHNASLGPPLSAACQQIVSRSLLVTAATL